jgi:hypothetical protein
MNSDNYNYESPITRIQNQLLKEMVKKEEDQFMCEVRQTIGYNIDKAELIKALNYDRDQYEKGYQDGKLAAKRAAKRIGQWIINSDGYYPYCSRCNKEPQSRLMTDYCPNCGAYMKGENNDKTTSN